MSDQNNQLPTGPPEISFNIGSQRVQELKQRLREIEKGEKMIPLLRDLGYEASDVQANLDWARGQIQAVLDRFDDQGNIKE